MTLTYGVMLEKSCLSGIQVEEQNHGATNMSIKQPQSNQFLQVNPQATHRTLKLSNATIRT
jgi:hypothetical protein